MVTDTAIKALRLQKKLYKVSDRDGIDPVVAEIGEDGEIEISLEICAGNEPSE